MRAELENIWGKIKCICNEHRWGLCGAGRGWLWWGGHSISERWWEKRCWRARSQTTSERVWKPSWKALFWYFLNSLVTRHQCHEVWQCCGEELWGVLLGKREIFLHLSSPSFIDFRLRLWTQVWTWLSRLGNAIHNPEITQWWQKQLLIKPQVTFHGK